MGRRIEEINVQVNLPPNAGLMFVAGILMTVLSIAGVHIDACHIRHGSKT